MCTKNQETIQQNNLKSRDYYFDNAKFILAMLVVLGHAYRPLIDENEIIKAIYLSIYTFHMPLFILISGYFAKNYSKEGQNKKLINSVLIPYIIFEILYSLYDHWVYQTDSVTFTILEPYWIMWFLFSLFLWRLILPYIVHLRYSLVIAVLLSVGIGYIDEADGFLSLSRTIAFFPFFLLGFYLKRHHIERLFTSRKRIIGYTGLLLFFLMMYGLEFHSSIDLDLRRWLYFEFPYEDIGHPEWYAGGIRIALILLALVASFFLLSIIPQRKTFFSKMGSRSIYVYLIHGFFIKFYDAMDLDDKFSGLAFYLLVTVFAILLTVLLSSQWIQRMFQPMIQPNIQWIYHHTKHNKWNKATY
ncbi:acyltransferase family protein [Melghirimyces algeriensis]|uniref:Fucose 4-O-acetylase n=1 Tax=Melghirimyces algeriensis TaxID=910412 RepID=A0A521EHG7_9BACL|nr:acyltransferase family protein [Melghirimyces algeriensis]SMO83353.1 Fucose 4-O-acetylase [Melghirimyces algeriensis]